LTSGLRHMWVERQRQTDIQVTTLRPHTGGKVNNTAYDAGGCQFPTGRTAVWWVTWYEGHPALTKPVQAISKGSLPEKVDKEKDRDRQTLFHLENGGYSEVVMLSVCVCLSGQSVSFLTKRLLTWISGMPVYLDLIQVTFRRSTSRVKVHSHGRKQVLSKCWVGRPWRRPEESEREWRLTVDDRLLGGLASATDVALVEDSDDDARRDAEQTDHDADEDHEEPWLVDHVRSGQVHHRVTVHCTDHCTHQHHQHVVKLLPTLVSRVKVLRPPNSWN